MNPRTLELAYSLLVLSADDDVRKRSISDVYQPHLERLTEEFYAWLDSLNDPLIEAGLGDMCADDLWDHLEHTYLGVRLGHGISLSDDYYPGPEHDLGILADKLACDQTYLEDGPYLGDDGAIYIYAYH